MFIITQAKMRKHEVFAGIFVPCFNSTVRRLGAKWKAKRASRIALQYFPFNIITHKNTFGNPLTIIFCSKYPPLKWGLYFAH